MEAATFLHHEANAIEGAQGSLFGGTHQKMTMPEAAARSTVTRKRLSNITNTAGTGRPLKERASFGDQQALMATLPSAKAKDYIVQLFEENSTLLRLLEERDKLIETSSTELQRLRFTLQKAHQQNWRLAQANSLMLAELNLGKDRVKALQHELGCTTAALRSKTMELEEAKRMHTQHKRPPQDESINKELNEPDASHLGCYKKPCNANTKRATRSRSMGSAIITNQETANQRVNYRRNSSRPRSSKLKMEQGEPTEDLFEIEDMKLPIRSQTGDSVNDDNSGQTQASPTRVVPVPDAALNPVTKGTAERDQTPQALATRRPSLGRPLRRAAEKVASYKEIPVNVKMRRAE